MHLFKIENWFSGTYCHGYQYKEQFNDNSHKNLFNF